MTSPRSLADFAPFSDAEAVLIERLDDGGFDRLSVAGPDGDEAQVRATLLRLLILGGPGAPPVHEKGVRLSGARIVGTLDLEGCRIPRDIGLVDCRFDGPLVLRSAILDTVFLDGSTLPGVLAERLEMRGDLFLRGARVDGPLSLPGARIGGALVADGATLDRPQDVALDAGGLDVRGGVLLRGAAVRGRLLLPGARLSGDFDLSGARIEADAMSAIEAGGTSVSGDVLLRHTEVAGEIRLDGLQVRGDVDLTAAQLSASEGEACRLFGASVTGAFILRQGARIDGLLNLNGASLGLVVDDPACWPAAGRLALNRCTYGGFLASPVDARTRLDWLARQAPGRWDDDFWPQPFEQLAAVLGAMGHNEDAGLVLFAKERLQRRARRRRAKSWALRTMLWLRDGMLRITVGYGRRSLMVLLWLIGLWLAGTGVLAFAWAEHAIRPSPPVVLRSPEWLLCGVPQGETLSSPSLPGPRAGLAGPGQPQLACYLAQPEAESYPAFNPWMLALDSLVPAVDTGQPDYWSADTRFAAGVVAKAVTYVLTVAGWALGLLAVAGFTGLVRSR